MFLKTASEICSLIDDDLTQFIHTIILIIEIGVPILLIIFGMLDFAKGVMASSDDDIKKGQRAFFKRLLAAVVVFFIFSVTQLVVGLVAGDDPGIWSCASAILNGTNKQTNSVAGSDSCPGTLLKSKYEECLSYHDEITCKSIFQTGCNFKDTEFLWDYYGNPYGEIENEYLNSVDCSTFSKSLYTDMFKSAYISCRNDTQHTEQQCLDFLKPYCVKK